MAKKIAVFPGSFDPITNGHIAIIKRSLTLFDELIVAIGVNPEKEGFFPITQRLKWIANETKLLKKVKCESFVGLTIDFCKSHNAEFILRGFRSDPDFHFENSIAMMNKAMDSKIETVFLLTDPEYFAINASIVRDIIKNKGDVSKFVPSSVEKDIKKYYL